MRSDRTVALSEEEERNTVRRWPWAGQEDRSQQNQPLPEVCTFQSSDGEKQKYYLSHAVYGIFIWQPKI